MESRNSTNTESGDYAAAVPMEISNEVASRADDLLREFAEDSGLETALIVDRSGALVAGISAEADVTVEVISALVAGASGAMRALVAQLGETGAMESLHLGGDRMIYLREIVNRFILVGVARATSPAGLVRSKAHRIEGELTELLRDIKPAEVHETPAVGTSIRSLREVALMRAAERLAVPEGPLATDPVEEELEEDPAPEDAVPDTAPFVSLDDFDEEIFSVDETLEFEPLPELPEPVVPPEPEEPREILEPLDFGEPEIVIESSAPPAATSVEKNKVPVDSPFEVESEEADEIPASAAIPESVFELEFSEDEDEDEEEDEPEIQFEEEDEREFELTDPEPPVSFFELLEDDDEEEEESDDEDQASIDDEEEVEEAAGEESPESAPGEDEPSWDEEDEDFPASAQAGDSLFELEDDESPEKEDETEDIAEEIQEMIAEEEEESEVRSSGPFYF